MIFVFFNAVQCNFKVKRFASRFADIDFTFKLFYSMVFLNITCRVSLIKVNSFFTFQLHK